MAKRSKRYLAIQETLKKKTETYELEEVIGLVKKSANEKFDETVEVAVRLGVDPRKADQMVRGTVVLPHGTGKTRTVLVFVVGDKEKEAKDAGADYVGGQDLIDKIQKENWLDFDVAIATPDMMAKVSRLGRVLGPRGLMPNPKAGTVTFDVGAAVKEVKAGRIEYRVDKGGIVHAPMGRVAFSETALKENLAIMFETIIRARPAAAKGTYVKSIYISTTHGPGYKLDPIQISNRFKG